MSKCLRREKLQFSIRESGIPRVGRGPQHGTIGHSIPLPFKPSANHLKQPAIHSLIHNLLDQKLLDRLIHPQLILLAIPPNILKLGFHIFQQQVKILIQKYLLYGL